MSLNLITQGLKKGTDDQPLRAYTQRFQQETELKFPANNVTTIKGGFHSDGREKSGKTTEDAYDHLTVQIVDASTKESACYFRPRDGTVWNQVHVFHDDEVARHPEVKSYKGAYAWISREDHIRCDGGKTGDVKLKTYWYDRRTGTREVREVVTKKACDATFISDLQAGHYINLTEEEFTSGVHAT